MLDQKATVSSRKEDLKLFLEQMEAAETMHEMAKALVWARIRLEARSLGRASI